MEEQKEGKSGMGFSECFSRMQQCCPAAGKNAKVDFSACEEMMKSFFDGKDGKVNPETMKSMMAMCCGGAGNESKPAGQG